MLMATGYLILTHRGEMSDRVSQQDVLLLRYMYTKAISDKKQPSAFGGQCKSLNTASERTSLFYRVLFSRELEFILPFGVTV